MTQIVKISPFGREPVVGINWSPQVGPEFRSFLQKCPESSRARIERESLRVIGGCIAPGEIRSNVGLVIGYVQSGKTASFIGVSALARDNGFKLVVVIGGTTKLLMLQTVKRLKRDLRLEDPDAFNRWNLCDSPTLDNRDGISLKDCLKRLLDTSNEGGLSLGIPIIVVMKHQKQLKKLSKLLTEIGGGFSSGLGKISALVIDDEAHMHSPNVAGGSDSSAIYAELLALRAQLPSHTLLQYTATPQANLLTEITDTLAPEFVRLLSTGDGYAGGRQFFVENISWAIRAIDTTEALQARNAILGSSPPESLKQAFASYLLVCANDLVKSNQVARQHSMLVHADVKNQVQVLFNQWLEGLKTSWTFILRQGQRTDPLVALFRSEYRELSRSMSDSLSSFEDVLENVAKVLQVVQVVLVNQQAKVRPVFTTNPYWVVNGGNQLGVGYTVEALCTTHMLRSPGVGLSDTIQQRGRFFGYRGDNLAGCRVWMEPDLKQAFVAYVEHEEELRRTLKPFDDNNLPLSAWRRHFLLDPSMELTRQTAVKLGVTRISTLNTWVKQESITTESEAMLNRSLVENLLQGCKLSSCSLSARGSDECQHRSGSCSLSDVREFLTSYRFCANDPCRTNFELLLMALARDEFRDDFCEIIQISGADPKPRRRGSKGGRKITLFQGPNRKYQGDSNVHAAQGNRPTLQLHSINIGKRNDIANWKLAMPFVAFRLTEMIEKRCKSMIIQI